MGKNETILGAKKAKKGKQKEYQETKFRRKEPSRTGEGSEAAIVRVSLVF